MAERRTIDPTRARRIASSLRVAVLASVCACVPEQPSEVRQQPVALAAAADPAKLITSRPNVAISDARIPSALRVENGCLVLGGSELRTVVWPAGTILSADRRAVIVPGAARRIAIGERLVAAGETVPRGSPPSSLQAAALAHGCPGTLVVVGEVVFEE